MWVVFRTQNFFNYSPGCCTLDMGKEPLILYRFRLCDFILLIEDPFSSGSFTLGFLIEFDQLLNSRPGSYKGEIVKGNRFLYKTAKCAVSHSTPSTPAGTSTPSTPASKPGIILPSGYRDVQV